jgi:predicted ATPase
MRLQLNNIGLIKEADVIIDGLSVIAGENDTGKSTAGKALYLICQYTKHKNISPDNAIFDSYTYLRENIFKEPFLNDSKIELYDDNDSRKYEELFAKGEQTPKTIDAIFIETPLVWNFTDFFRDVALVESQMNIKLNYPYLMKDLNFKLHIKSSKDGLDIKDRLTHLMGGEFKKDDKDNFYFDKQGKRVELVNTATGIKMFAIFQLLSQNGYLNKDTILVLDEPEVHLHPKWQLEMAKIIVELVKNGVKVLITSHSPYMIEALQRYSELEKLEDKTNFYLASDGYIKQANNNNADTLEKIFEKLSEPFDTFEELDANNMEKLING